MQLVRLTVSAREFVVDDDSPILHPHLGVALRTEPMAAGDGALLAEHLDPFVTTRTFNLYKSNSNEIGKVPFRGSEHTDSEPHEKRRDANTQQESGKIEAALRPKDAPAKAVNNPDYWIE
jgi:hypothetical protein